MTTKETIDEQTANLKPLLQTISFTNFIKKGGERNDNRQKETFTVKIDDKISELSLEELQEKTSNDNFQLIGLSGIGNKFQNIRSVVQGYNPNKPDSGFFERPVVAEGPHMILCVYAYDDENKLRIFRTLQLRNEQVYVDTIRGFADNSSLENGEILYDIDNAQARIILNITKIIKEEGGKKLLKINNITFLGAPVVNSSFVVSKSATFAVEVDYKEFRKISQVITTNELKRREEEFSHEGLTEFIIDLSVPEYFAYKLDPNIVRDNAADGPSDIVVNTTLLRHYSKLSSFMDITIKLLITDKFFVATVIRSFFFKNHVIIPYQPKTAGIKINPAEAKQFILFYIRLDLRGFFGLPKEL